MANYDINITKESVEWIVVNDKVPYYIPVIKIPHTLNEGDGVRIVTVDEFQVAAPDGNFGEYAQIKISADGLSDEAAEATLGLTVDDVKKRLPAFTENETLTFAESGRVTFKNSNLTYTGQGGSGTNGSTLAIKCYLFWGQDAAGNYFVTKNGSNFGYNSEGARFEMDFAGHPFSNPYNTALNLVYWYNEGFWPAFSSANNKYTTNITVGKVYYINPLALKTDGNTFADGNYTNMFKFNSNAYNGDYATIHIINSDIEAVLPYIEEYTPDDNPYNGADDDSPGQGGGGDRKKWDEETPVQDTPTANVLDTGMIAVYAPTEAQLNDFSGFLWSDLFSVDSLIKIFANPADAIISCHMLPFSVTHGLESQIMIGNVGSGINADILGAQYYSKNMGSISIDEFYGNFFDYSPYTKYSIFLPYIGYKDFIPDDFVGGNLTLYYFIDAITGACTAELYSTKHNCIMYQYSGSMLYQIPISSSNYNSAITSVVSGVTSIAGALIDKGKTSFSQVANAAVGAVSGSKPDITRSGSIGGASGWLGYQTPFIIRTRPNGVIAKNQQSYTGFPSYQAAKLSKVSGFTIVHDINLSLNGATSSEYDEANALLKSGVII